MLFCEPPSNTTWRSATAVNRWPKSHQDASTVSCDVFALIHVNVLYISSFVLPTAWEEAKWSAYNGLTTANNTSIAAINATYEYFSVFKSIYLTMIPTNRPDNSATGTANCSINLVPCVNIIAIPRIQSNVRTYRNKLLYFSFDVNSYLPGLNTSSWCITSSAFLVLGVYLLFLGFLSSIVSVFSSVSSFLSLFTGFFLNTYPIKNNAATAYNNENNPPLWFATSITCGIWSSPTDTYTLGYAVPAVALCKLVAEPRTVVIDSNIEEPTVNARIIIDSIINTTSGNVAGLFLSHCFLFDKSFPSFLSII